MIVERRILVIFGLILFIGSAAAIDLSSSTISEPGWLIANDGNDHSTITVYARAAGTPVAGATVTFSLDSVSQNLGTISPASPAFVQTGADGKATAVFTTGKKSGTATIIASISYNDGSTTPVQVFTIQRIDHDTAQGATFENPAELPVGSVTRVNITLVDRWGNRIDNKNTAETIRLTMADDGGAGLQDGSIYVTQKTYSTDAEGKISAFLRISTAVRSNYIQMDPIGNIVVPPGTYIQGVAESKPYYISQTPASPHSSLPADGLPANAVEIYYTVADKYNNPITGASVYCSSTDGMSVTAPTNTWGRLRISFGPKETTGIYTLKVAPLGNTSAVCTGINAGTVGYCSQDIEYYSTEPVDLTFTGNPQSITSLDVNSKSKAILQARVIDIKGNPVSDELVTFSLADPIYPGGPYIVTTPPKLSLLSAPVSTDGYATTEFSPGAFAVYGDAGYNPAVTGQVVANATWTNKSGFHITRNVTLVWKNYPYISTSSLGNCGNSQVGDQINITIQLAGDGAALWPKPIDVVLLNDRSGSMLQGGDPDRMVSAKSASSMFFSKLSSSDRMGEISFGDTRWAQLAPLYIPSTNRWDWTNVISYAYWAKTDDSKWNTGTGGDCPGCDSSRTSATSYSLTSPHHQYIVLNYNGGVPRDYGAGAQYREDLSFGIHTQADVDAALNTIVPAGGTPTREGIYRAVNMLPAPTSGRVRAIILLTDGEYNTGNDPEALTSATPRFSAADLAQTDSVIAYAKNKNIKIFPVGLSVSSAYQTILKRYADDTGGNYSNANDPSELAQIYTNIAGQLQETAGGNTQVSLKYDTVKIDDLPGDIKTYMEYVKDVHSPALPTDSTYYNKTHKTPTGTMTFLEDYPKSHDDGSLWLSKTMTFSPGEMKLNDTWSATFHLNLTRAGKIDLFGPDSSTISFTDASTGATQTGFIPAMQCRVRESIVNTGFGSKTLRVDNLSFVEGASQDPNVWTIKWNTTYDGDKTVQEAILYRVTGDPQWKTIPGGQVFISTPVFEETNQFTIPTADTTLWPPGKCFDLQIVAGAEDANAAISNPISKCKTLPGGTVFIKLE
jgi:hypothetical protein